MSDAEIRDDAVAHLKKTTVGYVNKHWKIPPQGSEWDQGLDLLAQIGQTTPPPDPPPVQGLQLVGLNSLNTIFKPASTVPPTWGSAPGTNGGGLFEIPNGYKLISTPQMPATWDAINNTFTKVCLAQGHPSKFWGVLGAKEKWRFDMFFPTQTWPNVTHWMAGEVFQWHTSSASGHHLAINWDGTFRIGRLSGKTSYAFTTGPKVPFNRKFPVEINIRWSRGIDGFITISIDNTMYVNFSGPTDFNDGDRRLQFGHYADRVETNEVQFTNMSVLRT